MLCPQQRGLPGWGAVSQGTDGTAQNNRHFTLPHSGDQPSKIKVWAGPHSLQIPQGRTLLTSPSFWGLVSGTVPASMPTGTLPGGSGPFQVPMTSLTFMDDICSDPVSSISRHWGGGVPTLGEVCPRSFPLQAPPTCPAQHLLHLLSRLTYSSVHSVSRATKRSPP